MGAGSVVVVGHRDIPGDRLAAVVGDQRKAFAPDRLDMRAPHDERHVLARQRELGPHVAADGAGADHRDAHAWVPVRCVPAVRA